VNYKEQLMERRKLEHQEKQKDFVNKLGEVLKQEIIAEAKKHLTII
jgi:hypothetical protein